MDRAREKIREYQAEIHNYVQQQSKAERVLQRLQADYEERIAVNIVLSAEDRFSQSGDGGVSSISLNNNKNSSLTSKPIGMR